MQEGDQAGVSAHRPAVAGPAAPTNEQASVGRLDEQLVVPLRALRRADLGLAGGKASNLGELIAAGFDVPDGFCVTTLAYREVARQARLAALLAEQAARAETALTDLASAARAALLQTPIPPEVAAAIRAAYAGLNRGGEPVAVAVRSSATAEDLPDASFAGQQDTYLDVRGASELLEAVRRCWASLWTERAVAYRQANKVDQGSVLLAVVVQQMVPARCAGVLFSANPLTGRRHEAVIDAVSGLGEALVSGAANPDHVVVDSRRQAIVERRAGAGPAAAERSLCLSDDQALELARIGERAAAWFGGPQDLEWAYDAAGKLWLVQSRPITSLFPLPAGAEARPDDLRVYFSFNVAQGVLGPLTPMGISALRRLASGLGRALGFSIDPAVGPPIILDAAARLFIDVTPIIRTRLGARILPRLFDFMETRSASVIRELLTDPRLAPRPGPSPARVARQLTGIAVRLQLPLLVLRALVNPAGARRDTQRLAWTLRRRLEQPPGPPDRLPERVEQRLEQAGQTAIRVLPVVATALGGFALARWLARPLGADETVLEVLRGVPYNPTTEMNLQLWDLAVRLRQDPAATALLEALSPAELTARYRAGTLPPALQQGLAGFLQRHGFRGVAEIDIGVPRWRDDPQHVLGVLANYLRVERPEQAPDAIFRQSAAAAEAAVSRIVGLARASGPGGWWRAAVLKFLFSRARALAGLRELPKLLMVQTLGRSRELLLLDGASLVERGQLDQPEDVFYVTLAETRQALDGRELRDRVAERRELYQREQRRRLVPRILLSDGTALYGGQESPAPGSAASVAGTPASPGTYRGQARVVLDPAGARLEPGEVLVAPSTDPGWTPLFMTAGALVMEMGGMMSHGAVVAREFGIPAVVGALGATSTIRTGQLITVDGSRGVVALE